MDSLTAACHHYYLRGRDSLLLSKPPSLQHASLFSNCDASSLPVSPGPLGLLALLLAAFLCWHVARYGRNRGPPVWPLIGALPSLLTSAFPLFHHWCATNCRRFGTWRLVLPGLRVFVTADPANVEHILKTNFGNYPKGDDFRRNFRDLLGESIFNSDGNAWRAQHQIASLAFVGIELQDLMLHAIQEEVQSRLLPFLGRRAEVDEAAAVQGGAAAARAAGHMDLQDVLLRFSFDSICRFAFGADPGCLPPAPPLPAVPFSDAFDAATAAIFLRFVLPPATWRAQRALGVGAEGRLRAAVDVIHGFADGVISKRRAEVGEGRVAAGGSRASGGPVQQKAPRDLLSRFLEASEGTGGGPSLGGESDAFLRNTTTSFLLAGRDSSAASLTWFFWAVAKHPEVEQKIVAEIQRVLTARRQLEPTQAQEQELQQQGSTSSEAELSKQGPSGHAPDCISLNDDSRPFSAEELADMHYLQAAICESMRLHPAIPANIKSAECDDTLPDGTFVPAGSKVCFHLYAMARTESIWGRDCHQFRPDRWLRNGRFYSESPFKYPVFNGGPRTCLGRSMAYLEMKLVAAAVLRSFRFEVDVEHKAQYKPELVLFMAEGLPVRVIRR